MSNFNAVGTFNHHQGKVSETDLRTGSTYNEKLMYYVLGLTEEAGEVAGKVKKYIRDDTPHKKLQEDIKAESGDTLWYLTNLLSFLGLTLEEVALYNQGKIARRVAEGIQHGSGDDR